MRIDRVKMIDLTQVWFIYNHNIKNMKSNKAYMFKGKQFWRSAIEVKDEQLPLLIKTEYGPKMAYNTTTWTEKSNPSWQHDLHVIQGPHVTREAREKIAFTRRNITKYPPSQQRQTSSEPPPNLPKLWRTLPPPPTTTYKYSKYTWLLPLYCNAIDISV